MAVETLMRTLLAAALLLAAAPALAQSAPNVEQRAAALVAQMTLEEKAAQLKDVAPAIPRLGIPAYNWWNEGLHGVARAGNATVFPQAIGLAATWDAPLIHAAAGIIATEFRAKYLATRKPDGSTDRYRGLTVWSPNINIFRDPRWGRGQETYGEDPYLTSRFGVAFIRGLQGADPAHPKVIAVVKHFAVHSGPEADRHREDVHPSPHDLEDTYLPAFRATITKGQAQGVMCAYNAVDGVPACASPLLQSRIRGAWGFRGHIVSDCAAIADFFLPNSHRYSKTPEEAVAAALNAGTDLFCAEFSIGKPADPQVIVNAVHQGLVSETTLDRALTRLFAARIRLGLLDAPDASGSATDFDTPAHRAQALEVSRASIVLLKNDGLLPLKADPARIAVIGPNADNVDALVGNYNGTPSNPVTILAGLRARFPKAQIDFVDGTGPVGTPFKAVPDAALCIDADCTRPGVKVEQFAGTELAGAPVKVDVDANVRFSWGRPVREERRSSVRFTGYIVPQETGPFRFRLNSDTGYRVLIDGKTVVDAWNAADPAAIADGEIALTAGRRYPITVEAIQTGSRGEQGLQWSNFSQREDAAVAAAANADLVVFVGGLTAHLEGEEMRVHADGFAGGDRTSLDLPAPQEKLLERLHATGKPVVLVLMNGSAMSVNWADAHLPAIIEAWYPGGDGGRAVAELIAGDFSPSGRLPVTFYKSADQLPAFSDYSMAGRTYRYFKGEVLYPFGYGLSYTRFAYGKPVLGHTAIRAGASVTVSVRVTNTGDRAGAEVAQLYVSRRTPGAPIRALQGFQRVTLAPGESREVRFTLDARALSLVDDRGDRIVRPGPVQLWVGGGQPAPAGERKPVQGAETGLQIVGFKRLSD
jgi:beta-glucosidase